MANDVWADPLGAQRGLIAGYALRVPFDQFVDAEPGYRLTYSVQENALAGASSLHRKRHFLSSLRPERAAPFLVPLAKESDRGEPALWVAGQIEVFNTQASDFTGTRPGVVDKQQQPIIPLALYRLPIRLRQKRIHLRLLQVRDLALAEPLERDRSDFAAPRDVFRTLETYVTSQRTNRCQPLVSSADAAPATLLEVEQELSDQVWGKVQN